MGVHLRWPTRYDTQHQNMDQLQNIDQRKCQTLTTICGGKIFESPSNLFSKSPTFHDCLTFCGEDSGPVDLDSLFFSCRGVEPKVAAAVFQELLTYMDNEQELLPDHFSLVTSISLTKDCSKQRLSPHFSHAHVLLELADYLGMVPLKKLCLVVMHFNKQEKGEKRKGHAA